jgi:arginyl-tRNA synthetase
MKTLHKIVIDELTLAFSQAYPDHSNLVSIVSESVTLATNQKFGHYQSNVALQLSKQLRCAPRLIANKITECISDVSFTNIDIAGPGFINFFLRSSVIAKYCEYQLDHKQIGVELLRSSEKVVVDFSSPNIAKEMHVGHLRSTIIGDSIARIFEFLGADVLRLNHVGDWGTAFGMLIVYLQDNHPEVLKKNVSTNLSELVGWYKKAKFQFDSDSDFKKRSQQQVVLLQSGDVESLAIWELICDISRTGFQKIYDILNINLVERGESFYNPWLVSTVERLKHQNMIVESDGAQCVYLDGFKNREGNPLPLIVQKSDGGFNYATTDLAALSHRVENEKANRIIYVTDNGQSLHFKMVFSTAEKAGIFEPEKTQVDHVGFGLVLGEDGKKLKTRSGDTVPLQSLLDNAVEKAKSIILEKGRDWDVSEIENAAKVIGVGAVKYADLSNFRLSDYRYSPERMLSFEGNTATFIIYSNARINSIIKKTQLPLAKITADTLFFKCPSEEILAFHLTRFSDVIHKIVTDLTPHYLTDYLYETAQRFNSFYNQCRIIDDENELSRLSLCHLTSLVITKGLELLGIEVLDRM